MPEWIEPLSSSVEELGNLLTTLVQALAHVFNVILDALAQAAAAAIAPFLAIPQPPVAGTANGLPAELASAAAPLANTPPQVAGYAPCPPIVLALLITFALLVAVHWRLVQPPLPADTNGNGRCPANL